MNEPNNDMNNTALDTTIHIKRFSELTTDELYDLLKIRSEVFVVEQNCFYLDPDGDDKHSLHLWITAAGEIKALCRVCPAGVHMEEVSIGRVICTERRKGYGALLMRRAIELAVSAYGAKVIDIEAQVYAKPFYEKAGFHQTSDVFMDAGVEHILMRWEAAEDIQDKV